MHRPHLQFLRNAIWIFCIGFTIPADAQQMVLTKGDTLYSGTDDEVREISFKLKDVQLESVQKVNIKVYGGSARKGIDFVLLEANQKRTDEIAIAGIKNKTGSFEIKVSADIQEVKTINLQVTITDNGISYSDIAKIIIMPASKKPAPEEPKRPVKETPVDSLFFIGYKQNRIPVYEEEAVSKSKKEEVNQKDSPGGPPGSEVDKGKDKVVYFPKKGVLKGLRANIPKQINIQDMEIERVNDESFNIKIISTQNEVFFATVKLTGDQFTDDKLYLNDTRQRRFIHAKDIFRLKVQKKDAQSYGGMDGSIIKFPLKKQ